MGPKVLSKTASAYCEAFIENHLDPAFDKFILPKSSFNNVELNWIKLDVGKLQFPRKEWFDTWNFKLFTKDLCKQNLSMDKTLIWFKPKFTTLSTTPFL